MTFLASRGINLEVGDPDDPPEAETANGLGNRKNTLFTGELDAHGVEVFADAVALLDAARAAGIRTAVVSASKNCAPILERAGLRDRFEVRVGGVEAAAWGLRGKPAPDTFLRAAELLGVQPADAVVLEAAITGVRAGREGDFGLVVGVDRLGRPEMLAENGADIVLSDLRDLLRAAPSPVPAAEAPAHDTRVEGIVVALPLGTAPDAERDINALVDALRDEGVDVVVTTGDPSPELAALASRLDRRGIGSGLILVIGWPGDLPLPVEAPRARVVSVASIPTATAAVEWVGGERTACAAILQEQLDRRHAGGVPSIDLDPTWTLAVTGDDLALRRPLQSVLTVSDSRFGTRGVREEDSPGVLPRVLAAGVYDDSQDPPDLLEAPGWTGLHLLRHLDHTSDRRTLDLRTGILVREQPAEPMPLRTVRFATLARPGGAVLRAEGSVDWLHAGAALLPPATDGTFERYQRGDRSTARTRADVGGSISAAASQRERASDGRRVVERLAFLHADRDGALPLDAASPGLDELEEVGFDRLLAEQRDAWARRWEDAYVAIDGDPDLTLAVRFCLFHLMGSAPTQGEAAVGARGVTGPGYRGHVFWDADVFMLPFFAATCPEAARAMLEYRIRRLEPARSVAADQGRRGARFPWESARTGFDVTPTEDRPMNGSVIPILTGDLEEHIVSDVAWAALQYAAWTGDDTFLRGPGRPLVLDTARYWASRVEIDDQGQGHISNVIGPDEYHERVTDNAFTNVIVRWHLRKAADLAEAAEDQDQEEVAKWRRAADALVDGYHAGSGLYEQFRGFFDLDDVSISQTATTPFAADLILGKPVVERSQIIKQPDVLMLHHLLPEEMQPGSLEQNVAYYEPRTSHGSSLSPAIHASLLARVGRFDEALRLLTMACRLDLDNLNHTTANGLHTATFGGVWQALVFGFAGIRPTPEGLAVDPRIPEHWQCLRLHLRFRGRRVKMAAGADTLEVSADGPVPLVVGRAEPVEVGTTPQRWRRTTQGWHRADQPDTR
jgi:HAD superfamily hydrolase (TIGR01509 family)